MVDTTLTSSKGIVDPRERSKQLNRVYQLILSWDPPKQQSAAPDDLGRETGTADEVAPSIEDGSDSFYHQSVSAQG